MHYNIINFLFNKMLMFTLGEVTLDHLIILIMCWFQGESYTYSPNKHIDLVIHVVHLHWCIEEGTSSWRATIYQAAWYLLGVILSMIKTVRFIFRGGDKINIYYKSTFDTHFHVLGAYHFSGQLYGNILFT